MANHQVHGEAYVVECPTCGAPAGHSCIVLRTALRDGVKVWCHPHVDRVVASATRGTCASCSAGGVSEIYWLERDPATGVRSQQSRWMCQEHVDQVRRHRFYNTKEATS